MQCYFAYYLFLFIHVFRCIFIIFVILNFFMNQITFKLFLFQCINLMCIFICTLSKEIVVTKSTIVALMYRFYTSATYDNLFFRLLFMLKNARFLSIVPISIAEFEKVVFLPNLYMTIYTIKFYSNSLDLKLFTQFS